MKLKAGSARVALLAISLLGLALAAAVLLRAQAAAETKAPPAQDVTAYLDYQDASYSYTSVGLRVVMKSSPFKKEPVLSREKVFRGVWSFGGGASNDVAFVWDRNARKLYVDLNRNLDLTDDPAGVFSSSGDFGYNYQTFSEARLPLRAEAGSRQALVDLSLYDYGSQPYCTASFHSFWQGKVTLGGEDWQVGILENPGSGLALSEGDCLLLRPWAQRNQAFSLLSGGLDALPFYPKVFFGNRAYGLQRTNEAQGDRVKMKVRFTEQTPKLGDLKIPGQFVERATLERGPYMVVIDKPEGTVQVPVGSYAEAKVCVMKGAVKAHFDRQAENAVGRITISATKPAVLNAGGPLTNSVSLTRQGRHLAMNYRLTGAGGTYQLVNEVGRTPPEFTVYQGDKRVASGKFEFG